MGLGQQWTIVEVRWLNANLQDKVLLWAKELAR